MYPPLRSPPSCTPLAPLRPPPLRSCATALLLIVSSTHLYVLPPALRGIKCACSLHTSVNRCFHPSIVTHPVPVLNFHAGEIPALWAQATWAQATRQRKTYRVTNALGTKRRTNTPKPYDRHGKKTSQTNRIRGGKKSPNIFSTKQIQGRRSKGGKK